MTIMGVSLKLNRQAFKTMLQLQAMLGAFLIALFFMDLLQPSYYDTAITAILFGTYAHAIGLSPMNGFRQSIVYVLMILTFVIVLNLVRFMI